MSLRFALWAAISGIVGLAACNPDDACDRGYVADHGYCYLVPDASAFGADAGPLDDAGIPLGGNPSANFGTPCSSQADCGGLAPYCGGQQLPVCTDINCMNSDETCPSDWICLDVTKYMPYPGVTSACVPNFTP